MTRPLTPTERQAIRSLRQAQPVNQEVEYRTSWSKAAGCLAYLAAALLISGLGWLGFVALLLEVWR